MPRCLMSWWQSVFQVSACSICTDRFCGRNSCPAVKDGNVVYRGDDNHLTATFSRTLAPAFSDVLIETGSLPAFKRK